MTILTEDGVSVFSHRSSCHKHTFDAEMNVLYFLEITEAFLYFCHLDKSKIYKRAKTYLSEFLFEYLWMCQCDFLCSHFLAFRNTVALFAKKSMQISDEKVSSKSAYILNGVG